MTTIRKNDAYSFQKDEVNNKTRIVRIQDNKVTTWTKGYLAQLEIERIKNMRESVFYSYCKSLIYN